MEQLTRTPFRPARSRPRRRNQGVALLLVLGSLVFIAALILAFVAGGGSEVKVSSTYAEGSRVNLLAQTAVSLVEAEIVAATKGQDSGGADLAWASQPGMIRTYDTSGNLAKYYKLYSAPAMVGTASPLASATNDVSASWYNSPAFYTDLNEPVTINGVAHFPILDGNLVKVGGGYVFPSAGTNIAPEGFYVTNAPVYAPPSGTVTNQAPMPVQWLYVLQKGQVVAPGGSGTTATITGASTSNPIVGRIAFWTDDESAKVNINTASEGSFSDTPRVASLYDLGLATKPPAHNEFQRYPGHPATTSLSAVFGAILPIPAPSAVSVGTQGQFKAYYDLAPKVADGGSLEGTAAAAAQVTPDADRLYASVDELMFTASRTNQPNLNPQAVEQARFFVTAHSRSPDENLFNQPRVCIWPIAQATTARTALDQLIAFTSTVNKVPYYFQRSLWTATDEYKLGNNQNLLAYLKKLCGRAIPGFGGSFAAKYAATNGGASEMDQILTEIFDYVRCTNIHDISSGATPFTPAPTSSATVAGEVVPTVFPSGATPFVGTKGFGRFPTVIKAGLLFIATEDGDADAAIHPAPANAVAAGKVRVQAALVFNLFDPAQGYPPLYPQCTLTVTSSTLSWDHGTMFQPGALSTYAGDFGGTKHWGGVLGLSLLHNTANGNTQADAMWGGPGDPLLTTISNAADFPDYPKTVPASLIAFAGGTVTVAVSLTGTSAPVQTITFNFPSGKFPVPTVSPNPTFTDSGTHNAFDSRKMANRLAPQGYYQDARAAIFLFQNTDTFESIQGLTGDYRLSAARTTISSTEAAYQFAQHGHWGNQFAHSFMEGNGAPLYGCEVGQLTGITDGYADSGLTPTGTTLPRVYQNGMSKDYSTSSVLYSNTPDGLPIAQNGTQSGNTGPFVAGKPLSDFDNGTGNVSDGAYINKVDEGAPSGAGAPAYYDNLANDPGLLQSTYFSPNRQLPSAVMFGSLPTGVISTANGTVQPWQTLLFHPDTTATHAHRGSGTSAAGTAAPPFTVPPDELLLDLFTMPVVEPYAISEPLSTAGRVNMNAQIVPFTYINRDTGVRAVLKSERILAIPNAYANDLVGPKKPYKQLDNGNTQNYGIVDFRCDLNVPETMKGFQARLNAAGDLFRSPAEICSLDLIPAANPSIAGEAGGTYGNMQAFWEAHRLTGDNSRERPYADVYPRLTTKSNSFTIHFRVQALKQAGTATPTQWREGIDQVTAEYRGSRLVERYIDPNTALDATGAPIPDYTSPAAAASPEPLSAFYRFRVVESKQFPP